MRDNVSRYMKYEIIEPSLSLDHPIVKQVLDIAKSILEDNKVLNVKNLYNIAKRELKIPRKGLMKILRFLINNNILIDGSKYTRESVLLNIYRKNIYNFIENNLGAHFSLLRKIILTNEEDEFGSSGQLIWHLEMLLKFDYIKKIKIGNYSIFLPFDLDEEVGVISFFLKDPINREIIQLFKNNEAIIQSDINKKIEYKRGKVYYRINNLLEFDILISEKEGKTTLYLNPDKRKKIIKTLSYIEKNFNNN